MKAILLGAGRGIRVSGSTTPKCLVEGITGWRVLDWLLNALSEGGGVDDFVFVGGDAMELIRSQYPQLRYICNPRWEEEHVIGSLFAAEAELDGPFYFSYSDIVYRPEVVRSLRESEADVTVVVDRQWKSRYRGRAAASLAMAEKVSACDDEVRWIGKQLPGDVAVDGEFIGLARFSERGARALRSVYASLVTVYGDRPYQGRRNLHDGHLTDLIQELIDQGGRVEVVWVDGDYAELDTPRDLSQFVFGTKAETLERLRPHLNSAHIQDGVRVQVADWMDDRSAVATALAERFHGQPLAVRSSALSEDTGTASQAGRYESVIGVEGDDVDSIATAMQLVVDSYGRDGHNAQNQVLVQPCLLDVKLSGVMMTRDLDTGADYIVIHYDSSSGRTDSVTAGRSADTRVVKIRRDASVEPADEILAALRTTAKELEEITGSDALDIEFAQTSDGELHVLQVRPIATAHAWSNVDAGAHEAELEMVREFLGHRFSAWPSVGGKTTVLGQMPDWNPAEMIGPYPRPLARSLYEILITDHTWRLGRSAIGYADPFPHALMVEVAGRPFIDVRMSANNLLPAHLAPEIRARVIDAGIRRLRHHHELHDKIEFEVFPTSWTFDLGSTLSALQEEGLSAQDARECEVAVGQHTRELLRCGPDVMDGLLARTEALRSVDSSLSEEVGSAELLAAIGQMLATTVRDGTLPFATMARMAFVGTSLLRSLVTVKALRPDEMDGFLRSIRTISSEMLDELESVRSGRRSREEFLARYGHLRPGTYDILSQRYDHDPGLYFPPPADGLGGAVPRRSPGGDPEFKLSPESRELVAAYLRDSVLEVDVDELFSFVAQAIRGREEAKFCFSCSLSAALELLAEFGERHGLNREEVAMLDIKRLLDLSDRPLPSKLDDRLLRQVAAAKLRRKVESAILLPELLTGVEDLDIVQQSRSRPNFVTTTSVRASTVRIGGCGDRQAGFDEDISGQIVLIESADPGYDWIFARDIAGLITRYGGANSHMTIRCAEFGLPAAIGCGETLFETCVAAVSLELDCGQEQIHVLG